MRRIICASSCLVYNRKLITSNMAKPISDFKEWKFRLPPSYVQLPITGYPDYNIPRAVKDAVFVKVSMSRHRLLILCMKKRHIFFYLI